MKSVKPKDGSGEPPTEGGGRNAEANFHGQKRSNDTHASTTDPDALLYRKGPGMEARPCYIGHGLMENRSGPLVANHGTVDLEAIDIEIAADSPIMLSAALLDAAGDAIVKDRWRRLPAHELRGHRQAVEAHGLVEIDESLNS